MFITPTNRCESVFIKRLQSGDEEAFQHLVQEYHEVLIRLAVVIVPEMSIAEDVVQETWLAVLKGIRNFEGRSTIKTWLYIMKANWTLKLRRH